MARSCLKVPGQPKQLVGGTTVRVFTIAQRLAEANLTIVTSQIFYLSTLIDCGTTYYFVTKSLVEKLGAQPIKVA